MIDFSLSLTGQGNLLILIVIFDAIISCVLTIAAYITLRIRRPNMQHPYRIPSDILTSGAALALACVTVVVDLLVDPWVMVGTVAAYVVLIGYLTLYSRHHLVPGTLEEEFTAIQTTGQNLR